MPYNIYATEIFADLWLYLPLLILFIIIYILLFKKYIWGIFDPLLLTAITMGAASFAVFTLWINKWCDFKYIISFIILEACLIIGFRLIPSTYKKKSAPQKQINNNNRTFIAIFTFISGSFAIIIQLYIFYKIGIVLFQEGVNHLSVFDGIGFLKAFRNALITIFFISFFYKNKTNKLNIVDYIISIILIFGILTSGSKSGILAPITLYFIVDYYFHIKNKEKITRIKLFYILCLALIPISVYMIQDNVSFEHSIVLFVSRLIGSGDIFVMGYNDDVIRNISANSFLEYVFYPGWGSILKTIGVNIDAPTVIGVDIYDYHYNLRTAGPNARYNFLYYYFFGTIGGAILAFSQGLLIGYIRNKYGYFKHNIFNFFLTTILYVSILDLIVDINIFLNNIFWTIFIFLIIYMLTDIFYRSIKQINYA